ncbi:hypothetical protein J6590_049768 [Homalodisca vitripennis]|nr:hypothetical protein J6590_049768 [Homalodisca vitripennis]
MWKEMTLCKLHIQLHKQLTYSRTSHIQPSQIRLLPIIDLVSDRLVSDRPCYPTALCWRACSDLIFTASRYTLEASMEPFGIDKVADADIIKEQVFPEANVLMGRKTELLYNRVCAYLKEVLPEWYPTDITCECERALTSALIRPWPESRVTGCRFHSANLTILLVLTEHEQESHVQLLRKKLLPEVFKMYKGLPLFRAHMAVAGYDHIVNFAQQAGVLQNLAVFINYVHRVWITGVGVESFSVYRQSRRTNNDMVSYYRNLRDTMHTAHPERVDFTRKINILTTRLDGGQYSVPEFLEAAIHQLDNIHNVAGKDKNDDENVVGVDGGSCHKTKKLVAEMQWLYMDAAVVEQWQKEVVQCH